MKKKLNHSHAAKFYLNPSANLDKTRWDKSIASLILLVCIINLAGCSTVKVKADPVRVTVNSGNLVGQTLSNDRDVVGFTGIPYAEPPIGNLRWAAPKIDTGWLGTLNAKRIPPACIQQITETALSGNSDHDYYPQSEDCLYLNVFAPTQALKNELNKPLPVLFMIHGGGRARGAANRIRADIAFLNRQGIIVVTAQYRLGIFSFLAHPELSAESPQKVSGNYGTQDLMAALKWVKTNIKYFGGDPSAITIAGPSGGGTATGVLLASPLAKGLFQRAALLCSNAGIGRMHHLKQPYLDQESAETLGIRFAKSIDTSTVAELRNIPARRLQQQVLDSGVSTYDPPSGAGDVVDGWIFPQPIIDMHRTGTRNDVPVLLGFNQDELSLFGNAGLIDEIPASAADYERIIKARYGELADLFLQHYPANDLVGSIFRIARDQVVGFGSETVAQYSHKVKSPTYFYYMAHRPADADDPIPGGLRDKGVSHCIDDKFFFHWYPQHDESNPAAFNTDQRLANIMSAYLINFVKNGNPNQTGMPQWKPYDRSAQNYMRFERGAAQPAFDPLPGTWELHEKIRLHEENQGVFRSWLGGWASNNLLHRHAVDHHPK